MGKERLIISYTKDDAVADGQQINLMTGDTEKITKEAGFRCPLYITSGVLEYVNVPEGLEKEQDFDGRLWDLLTMARLSMRKMILKDDYFESMTVFFQMMKDGKIYHEEVKFFIVFNDYEGITIMLPEEY